MMETITETKFHFPGTTDIYNGKVRDVYTIDNKHLVMVVSDRISAFDVVLPKGIPYKGQVLNQIASEFLDATKHIVSNWKISTPDPMVTIGHKCKPYPVEMIVRAYLTGSSWRAYKKGARDICGVPIPEGMKEHQAFESPILTPTTKAGQGAHDENISRKEIIRQGLVDEDEYKQLEKYALALFERGTEIADKRGLILVDTKYEFGKKDGKIYLIDEIHTPDSSRYFYKDTYQENFKKGRKQRQLSKEFVREWLMEQGFNGETGQAIPEMTDSKIKEISARYIELYEKITSKTFIKADTKGLKERIEKNVKEAL